MQALAFASKSECAIYPIHVEGACGAQGQGIGYPAKTVVSHQVCHLPDTKL